MGPLDSAELIHGFDRFALSFAIDEPDEDEVWPLEPWLVVSLDARVGSRVWSVEDACLTRGEAVRLADWFEKLAELELDIEPIFAPHESNLRFEWTAQPPALRITCDLEFAPPEWEGKEPAVLVFPHDGDQLRGFAVALRQQVAAAEAKVSPSPKDDPLIPKIWRR
jgi:hypothetical protein